MEPRLSVEIGTELRPGELGAVVALHGALYAAEQGYDAAFEAYVAEGLARFVLELDPRTDRIWLARAGPELVGSLAIVGHPGPAAQLRWFLLQPDHRGTGLGRRMLGEALAFCRGAGARSVFLLTAAGLDASARLYRSAGFRMVSEELQVGWGPPVTVQRYEMEL